MNASEIVQLEGPPAELDALLELVAEQFGSRRRLTAGHRDQGLADQFRRLRNEWSPNSAQSLWFGSRLQSGALAGLAVVTRPGLAWSNRAFAGGAPFCEFAYAYTDKTRTLGMRDFTLEVLARLPAELYPVRVYGYALSQAVGYWARCAPTMGAVAAHNLIGVPTWIWLDRSLVGRDLREPAACADAVRRFPMHYTSSPALDPALLLSVGTVRASDSPFARAVCETDGRPHALSVTPELAAAHEARVAAAFAQLPIERQSSLRDHFARLGLTAEGRRTLWTFWLRFMPIILLEDRPSLWPWLDALARLPKLSAYRP